MGHAVSPDLIWRDYSTDGDSGSGAHKPLKSQIRTFAAELAALQFDTRAAATGYRSSKGGVPADVKALWLMGYAAAGDAPPVAYVRVDSEPAHDAKLRTADRYKSDGASDATNGGWWEVAGLEDAVPVRALSDDDDAAFAAAKSVVENLPGWRAGFGVNPGVVDLQGYTYTLTSAVQFATGVHLRNGQVQFTEAALGGDYGLCLGLDANTGTSYTQIVEAVTFGISGSLSANKPAALLAIPRCFATSVRDCNFNAGFSTYRTRYGLYAGRWRCWQFAIEGGRYYGGECPLRVGREGDHTKLWINPAVADHGRVANRLICNPRGYYIGGGSEHADGPRNIAITSETNGSDDVADGGVIEAGYLFNDANASAGTGWANGNSIVEHGTDVPGTEGWDQAGVITSGGNGGHLTIRNCVAVSDYVQCCFKLKGLAGFIIENVKWWARGRIDVTSVTGTFQAGETITGGTSGTTATVRSVDGGTLWLESDDGSFTNGETITGGTSGATGTADTSSAGRPRLAEFVGGACAESYIKAVRNQNTGSLEPAFSSSASQVINVDLPQGGFTPKIEGKTSAGSLTVNSREGSYYVRNSTLHATGFIDWSSASGASGDVVLALPSVASKSAQRGVAALATAGFSGGLQGIHFGDAEIKLQDQNSTADVTSIPAAGNIHYSIALPLDFAD